MEYKFGEIETAIKAFWKEKDIYRTKDEASGKPKYYVLDMFPYPSGAGLHVGHPLGYLASDIYARYKRMKGYNVLHPMGYDSFGLPAEQYAIQTGQHPAVTTEQNIATFRRQMDQLGFSFDWSREVRTSDPEFYKWTQWIFIQLFHSWYNKTTDKAEPIETLVAEFEKNGNKSINAHSDQETIFSADEWKSFSAKQKSDVLLNYRIAYIADSMVNWCPALGTVLANDEVKDGVSERGGYPVERKLMKQWSMRITAYADRLLKGLDGIEWSESIKETQRNWIGKSEGCSVKFEVLTTNTPLLGRGAGGEVSKNEEDKKPGYLTANSNIANFLVGNARANRKEQTEAEELLWSKIRNQQLGAKIRRQHYIGNYVVDFVAMNEWLVIELDGEQHKDQKDYDTERTKYLNESGFKVLRFWNEEVVRNTDKVVSKITDVLNSRKHLTPNPSPKERGGAGKKGDSGGASIEVFTTRPDTIFGVTFLTLAPEHELIKQITPATHKAEVDKYVTYATNRSERERMSDVKKITGQFTGAYTIHPFTGKQIPVWVGEYVLAGYGTGAVMGVPAHDSRDYAFAKHFNLDIIEVVKGGDISKEAFEGEGPNINSSFLDGLNTPEAKKKAIEEIENKGIGKRKINFKLRDAIFGRQRYWGEPIPIYYAPAEASTKKGDEQMIPLTIDEKDLPLILPEVDKYLPTEDGEPPLARAANWKHKGKHEYETTTMPGWAGSSWYFLRYEDPHNNNTFASKEKTNYWQNIDFYIGGAEHSTGHLLYFRFWTKFLYDLGYIPFDEPAKRLVNQGMIQGMSHFLLYLENISIEYILNIAHEWLPTNIKQLLSGNIPARIYFSYDLMPSYPDLKFGNQRIEINFIDKSLNIQEAIKDSLLLPKNTNEALFICADGVWIGEKLYSNTKGNEGRFHTLEIVEKMSKSKYNVVNPDDVISKYGSDCFRMYEMFLGPLELSKPWDTKGIDGVSRFLRKFWKLFYDDNAWVVTNEPATNEELKALHKTIKKTEEDMEKLSFNTSVSSFMICVNTLTDLKCHKAEILKDLLVIMTPFAPFTTEYLWQQMKQEGSIVEATFPKVRNELLVENTFEYPIAINGKTRAKIELPLDLAQDIVEKEVLALDAVQKHLEGKTPKKIIVVKGRMVNVVV